MVTAALGGPPLGAYVEAGVARHGGVQIAWRAHGRGEPVLMSTGFAGTGHGWFRLLPHLARGRRAIVFDQRGTGDSDRPPGLWGLGDLAGDALAVLDAAGAERAHVLGASTGGMVAQRLALDQADRVRSLVLACTHPGRRPRRPWGLPLRLAASVALRALLGPSRAFRVLAPLLYSQRSLTEGRARLEADLVLQGRDRPLAAAAAQVAAIARHDARDRLGELRPPVLVLHGEEDRLVPPAAARELAGLLPGARLTLLARCGHVLTADAEPEAAAAIMAFLDEVERGAADHAGAAPGSPSRRDARGEW